MQQPFQDEDIRIASSTPSKELKAAADLGESVAQEYTRHKDNGNIFMANRLGEELARPLKEDAGLFDHAVNSRQEQFLYGFAVHQAIYEGVAVSILADTALHSFLKTVKLIMADAYDAMTDTLSDTVYRLGLSDRQPIGEVFAQLVGCSGEEETVRLGQELYQRYSDFAKELVGRFEFRP